MSFDGLRIALVGPLAPPAGGMAMQTAQLAKLLQGSGAHVEVVQTNSPYKPTFAGRVPVLRALVRLLPYVIKVWRAAGRNHVLHLMANSGWSWHLSAAPAIWIAHWRGTPVVVNYRGGGAAEFLQGSAGVVRTSMRRAARLIVPSAFLQQVFAQFGIPAEVVPNIIDLQLYQPVAAAASNKGSAPHLIVTRNLEPIYDNQTALRVLAMVRRQLPDATLTIAGTGPELARLQALARELGVEECVSFAGRLGRTEMAALYRQATLMLNTSLTDNMPNSVLEALASGVPVVSTDVGGVPYLLTHEQTALLVKPQQPEQMAAAVLRLLQNAQLRDSLVANGLQDVQRYTWPCVAPVLLQAYTGRRTPADSSF